MGNPFLIGDEDAKDSIVVRTIYIQRKIVENNRRGKVVSELTWPERYKGYRILPGSVVQIFCWDSTTEQYELDEAPGGEYFDTGHGLAFSPKLELDLTRTIGLHTPGHVQDENDEREIVQFKFIDDDEFMYGDNDHPVSGFFGRLP